ncbi:MAG: hypothetical protein ACRYG2_36255, partial [Janthinobacterium lividum]
MTHGRQGGIRVLRGLPSMPDAQATTLSPASARRHVLDDPRDALVGQLLDDLRAGDLAAESLVAQVEREGPGVISVRL